ncbi:sugar ABC transporter ATP-binding protein [Neobacillus cucumis]|uniref:sugar ABC transporter ATP-binding protein n=1 Tax=Neobacillus cucumis TaxID=1740721 RepID=UPI00203D9343|nr:sugar ABC transporter ATP-binding protein [Neobacillus cucumis]MCM3726550.1 sugar ABC transporter ATP-binding protein [Neobacillus cucumis]
MNSTDTFENLELIKLENISKRFGTMQVLDNVSFCLHKGEIMALAGHNGAGKSVLCKIMGGFIPSDSGQIFFENKEALLHSPRDAYEKGYYVIPQEITISKQLSVSDNIFIGRNDYSSKAGLVHDESNNQKARLLMKEYFNVDIDPKTKAGTLDSVTQRLIQIVRCLDAGAKVIVFDETTAGLAQHERIELFKIIRDLAKRGIGIIFISHIISEMMELTDTVTILRAGKLITVAKTSELTSEALIDLIVGKHVTINQVDKATPSSDVIYSVTNVTTKNNSLRNISFDLKKGEIVGIYGLRNQGQALLMETIFGAYNLIKSGEIRYKNKKISIKSPVDSLKNGIVYLPNRGEKTVFKQKSILENFILLKQNFHKSSFILNQKNDQSFATEMVKDYNVRGISSFKDKIHQLSGGNIQKVLVSRCMSIDPDLLIVYEPTEGIDIGSKEEIKETLLQKARLGTSIIIVTSEIDDIIEVCNRAIILRNGQITNEVDACEENRNLIIELSVG